jgi:hypothetical protein
MRIAPVVLNVGARLARYSRHQQYFSKVPGFMLPIAGTIAIGHPRKVRLTQLRVLRKRRERLKRSRAVRNRKVKLRRLRAVRNRKLRSTKFRVARKRWVNRLSGQILGDESRIGLYD